MAIAWTPHQRKAVVAGLSKHPVDSGRCEAAARTILPIGRQRDPGAAIWRLTPMEGRYVVPRVKLEAPWYYHFTVELEVHCVDALTGADGTTRTTYLDAHWTEGDAIRWTAGPEVEL